MSTHSVVTSDEPEFMASPITAAATGLKRLTTPTPVFVLNVLHPDHESRTYIHGGEPQTHTLDLGAEARPASASTALEWTASQVVQLHDWPLPLRLRAWLTINRAVRDYPDAAAMARVLGDQHVDAAAVEHARFAAGQLNGGGDEEQRQAALDAWLTGTGESAPATGPVDAWRQAATDQGLDPLAQALTDADIEHEIEQTGGFCMMLRVPTPHGFHIGITASEEPQETPEPHWLVMRYSDTEHDGGVHIGSAVPTADVIALLAGHLASAADTSEAVRVAVCTAVGWLSDELNVSEGSVDELLDLVVNAAVYAARHPDDGTLAGAIWESYEGGSCVRGCDDEADCEDPEHSDIVEEVLGSIAELG